MSEIYNWLRDGGMILKIKPTITNCNTLKVFPVVEAILVTTTTTTVPVTTTTTTT
jgi:hypothetical protein